MCGFFRFQANQGIQIPIHQTYRENLRALIQTETTWSSNRGME